MRDFGYFKETKLFMELLKLFMFYILVLISLSYLGTIEKEKVLVEYRCVCVLTRVNCAGWFYVSLTQLEAFLETGNLS